MEQKFWFNDPKVLLNKKYITELWPSSNGTLEAKLNAITRLVVLLGTIGYLYTREIRVVVSALVTLGVLVLYYNMKHDSSKKEKHEKLKSALKEGFTNPELYKATKPMFTQPTKKNPMMNVALPEIQDDPQRKQAAPSFNPKVEEEINDSVKQNLDKRLFHDLGDNIDFENSMRGFYTTANTQIPNDQKAFAEFCYGSMKSCKEGDGIQCEKKNYRYTTP